MEEAWIKEIIKGVLGDYTWLFIVGFVGMFFKDLIKEATAGVAIFFGNTFNEQDIVYISGRKARIQRIGLRKTIFIMLDTDPARQRPVFNHRLASLNIEKSLPMNGIKEIKDDIKELKEKMKDISTQSTL